MGMTFEEWCSKYAQYCSKAIYHAIVGKGSNNLPDIALKDIASTDLKRFKIRGIVIGKGKVFSTKQGQAQRLSIGDKDAVIEVNADISIADELGVGYEVYAVANKSPYRNGYSVWITELLEVRNLLEPNAHASKPPEPSELDGKDVDKVLGIVKQVESKGHMLEKKTLLKLLNAKGLKWEDIADLVEVYERDGKEYVRLKKA